MKQYGICKKEVKKMRLRRYKKYGKYGIKGSLIIACGFLLLHFAQEYYLRHKTLDSSQVQLSKCTDGDTAHFLINGVDQTVRFLAIDTPETVKPNTPVQPYGKEASDRTCELLSNAEVIRLEYEESNKTDKYGRLLAWVFADDILIQQDLISKGYAKIDYIYGEYKYTNILEAAQEDAKNAEIGLWSSDE